MTRQSIPSNDLSARPETVLRPLSLDLVAASFTQAAEKPASLKPAAGLPSFELDLNRTDHAFAGVGDLDLLFRRAVLCSLAEGRMGRIARYVLEKAAHLDPVLSGSMVRQTAFRLFCAGSRVEDAIAKASEIALRRQHSILEYIPAPPRNEESYDRAAWEIKAAIEAAARSGGKAPFVFLKPGSIADLAVLAMHQRQPGKVARIPSPKDQDHYKETRKRLDSIAEAAKHRGVFLMLGAGEVRVQAVVDGMALRLMRAHNQKAPVIHVTVQMYRSDRMRFVRTLTDLGAREGFYVGLNLVRGDYLYEEQAYARSSNGDVPPLYSEAAKIDRNYRKMIDLCLGRLDRLMICFSSHNPEACAWLYDAMKKKGIAAADPRICFAQFLGVADHVSSGLVDAGCNVLRAVPYGSSEGAFPFVLRRLRQTGGEGPEIWRESRLLARELARRRRERLARFRL